MTAVQFRDWAAAQDSPYEFDGSEPVAMTGGTPGHSVIAVNITTASRTRLRGGLCSGLGSDAGIRTEGEKVRFPDATVTCSRSPLPTHSRRIRSSFSKSSAPIQFDATGSTKSGNTRSFRQSGGTSSSRR